MKQRRTATFSKDILVIGDELNRESRLVFYESMLKHFLLGTPLPSGDDVASDVRIAFAGAMPMMRKIQAQFDNGASEKKFNGNAKGLLCPSEGSQIKPSEANVSQTYNNKYPFPNLIYIFNKYITTNQPSAHARVREETNKKTMVASAEEVLSKLQSEDEQLYQYFYQIIQTIEKSGAMSIYGTLVPANKIIQAIHRLVLEPNFETVLARALNESSQPKVRDQIKYSISLLYNLGNKQSKQAEKNPHGFAERHYTDEELMALYDNLDDEGGDDE